MHMIRHETVTEQGETMELAVLAQQGEVSEAVRIAGEDYLSGIAPLRNMMGNAGDDDAREASHACNIAERSGPESRSLLHVCEIGPANSQIDKKN